MVFLTVTLLKISSFQQNIVRHTKEQGSMTHTQEKKSTETVSEEVEMLVLLDKDLKSAIKNISWRRKWQPTPVFLPRESCGQRSLVGCCPQGRTESDTTEATQHACLGEGNSNPFQCSCLENPRDRGAWWAAVYGVAQSQTRLKRLSCSSSSATK